MRFIPFILLFFICCSKKSSNKTINDDQDENDTIVHVEKLVSDIIHLLDSSFIDIEILSNDFIFDLKYATSENFLNEPVYTCGSCFLRYSIAKKLALANEYFLSKGYKIKLFDCYRPLSVQKQMWEIMPDARYVANPNTSTGSYHNRGAAVDITLIDVNGNELDMGTPFDHFGEKSHFDFAELPAQVIANRIFLRDGMELAGFNGIRTEWWHFSTGNFPVSDQQLCPEK